MLHEVLRLLVDTFTQPPQQHSGVGVIIVRKPKLGEAGEATCPESPSSGWGSPSPQGPKEAVLREGALGWNGGRRDWR